MVLDLDKRFIITNDSLSQPGGKMYDSVAFLPVLFSQFIQPSLFLHDLRSGFGFIPWKYELTI
jgi:hypothetical protein